MDRQLAISETRLSCGGIEQFVAGERGIAPFSTSFVRRGLGAAARAT
jgi:hypothetical protein